MATEKFTSEKTIKIETSKTSIETASDLSIFLPKHNVTHKFLRYLLYGFLLIIVLLSLTKIPYCGSYIDAYVFEFVFGSFTKFFIYLFLILFFVAKIINRKFSRFLTSKMYVVGSVLIVISVILITAIVNEFMFGKDDGFSSFTSFEHFDKLIKKYVNDFNDNVKLNINHVLPFIWKNWSAGFFGNMIPDLYGILLILITGIIVMILIFIAVLLFSNQTKSHFVVNLKKKIVKLFKIGQVKNNELEVQANDIKPEILQKSTIKQEAIQIPAMTPPISFLSETSVDNFLSNKTQAKQYADIITTFLHKFDSIIQLQKINVTPLYSEIAYDIEKQDIMNDIFSAHGEILHELKVDSFNIVYKNNAIRFEILNSLPSKISLKSIYGLLKKIDFNNAIIGVDENLTPLLIDINKKQNTLLIGTFGSGVSMLMTTMLISLAYTNNPKDLGMVILSPNNDKILKHLCLLPHLIYPIKNEQHDITKTLIDLQNEINNRELLFKKNKSRSLSEYNSSQQNDLDCLKIIVVSIFNFNIVSKISIQNKELITDIIKRGPRVGISSILLSNNVDSEVLNQEIYKELDTKLFMKLEFEQESIQLLNSKRGIELFGNGDGYCFDSETKRHIRFQSCYMNIEELIQIIKIIETFYSVKSKLN